MEKPTNLPASNDPYWEFGEKMSTTPVMISDSTTCQHELRADGNQVQCAKCNWGFFLNSETEIKDNHVYLKTGKKLI